MSFHKNHRLLAAAAFFGFVALSLLIAVVPAIESMSVPPTPGLRLPTPEEARGRELYVSEGCSYCHSQLVRPLPADRVFGRPSAASDYVYATPQLLGTARNGPDLENVGNRQPDSVWNSIHLYNPRSVVKESVMPAFHWYFQTKSQAEPGDTVIPVPPAFVPEGNVVVATAQGQAIVAYLLSLKQPPLQMSMGPGGTPVAVREGGQAGATLLSGEQIYSIRCVQCHQSDGNGLPDFVPPLRGNPVVTSHDPLQHILTVLQGLQGKMIAGKTYGGKMPSFAGELSDEEIAAVINHERTSWGNNAPPVTSDDVKKARGK
jgi:cbb3-type cytochrome oxidase cytochrome c subunit/mono/diheme cytochrome c family protein